MGSADQHEIQQTSQHVLHADILFTAGQLPEIDNGDRHCYTENVSGMTVLTSADDADDRRARNDSVDVSMPLL